MAFAVDVFANSRPIGKSISRLRRSFRFLSGATLFGAGVAASAWIVTTVAAMHAIAPSAQPGPLTDISLKPKVALVAPARERIVHVAKFSRLGALTAKGDRVVTPSALTTAFIGSSAPLAVAEATPPHRETLAAATPAERKTKDDVMPAVAASTVASATPSDRIVIPSKQEVAAIEGSALFALATVPRTQAGPVAQPARDATISQTPGPVEVASIVADEEMKHAAEESPTQPFDLVLSDRNATVPLPMARPDGLNKRTATTATRPPEPVLAYARPDVGDDEGEIPIVPKRLSNPVARNGVAVYDISANVVYLPNGERLEAHSGLGKMRDNPRYVHEKNRGPTPPHTYALTLRESLFHGVEAIRLNPVGGAGNVYNRVGLLAHTYMLGARGDSNGCVSVKDYKRFLAAFKRGDIRQLVVVTSMPNRPASRLASLFSSRS
jgi:hypothetical protein